MTAPAPDEKPEEDQCGKCGHWYTVRDGEYGACPEHREHGSSAEWAPLPGNGSLWSSDPSDADW